METLRIPSKNRYLVFVAVAGTHALVLSVVLRGSRTLRLPFQRSPTFAAFIVTRPARPHLHAAPPPRNESSAPLAPIVEPITLAPPASVVTGPSGRAVDWNAAARQAAAATLERDRRKRISFGFPPGGKSAITLGVPSPSTPTHHAGESDRTSTGEVIEWTSDRCYIASDPPPLWEPDVMKRARITRGGCLPPPGPDPGELFKSLPIYKKLHPQ